MMRWDVESRIGWRWPEGTMGEASSVFAIEGK